jgi:hypothetical protein
MNLHCTIQLKGLPYNDTKLLFLHEQQDDHLIFLRAQKEPFLSNPFLKIKPVCLNLLLQKTRFGILQTGEFNFTRGIPHKLLLFIHQKC